MRRRELIRPLASGALISAALAACGGPAGGTEPLKTTRPATDRVSWMHSANPQTSGFDKIEEAFKAKYPNRPWTRRGRATSTAATT